MLPRSDSAPLSAAGAHGRQLRIMLYSHDAMGLGHVRRNLFIVRTAARHRELFGVDANTTHISHAVLELLVEVRR